MAIQTKKITVGDKSYKIRQHPATEGCAILERYGNAVVAFAVSQEHIVVENKLPYPFNYPARTAFDGRWLALNQFLDKVANPDGEYERFEQPKPKAVGGLTRLAKASVAGLLLADQLDMPYLTGKGDTPEPAKAAHTLALANFLDGGTADGVVPSVERIPTPLSYPIDYKATAKQVQELDLEAVFEEFFRHITFNDELVDLNELSIVEVAQLLSAVIEYNFLHLWTKERFSLPANYSGAGAIQPPRSLEKVSQSFSQSNVIYNILRCSQPLATLSDLSTTLSVSDAFDANETALRIYFEDSEMRKEAERQAKTNGG